MKLPYIHPIIAKKEDFPFNVNIVASLKACEVLMTYGEVMMKQYTDGRMYVIPPHVYRIDVPKPIVKSRNKREGPFLIKRRGKHYRVGALRKSEKDAFEKVLDGAFKFPWLKFRES